ncbi:MAG: chorismate synthase [Candidatus Cryptobacteroides sp.]
MDSFGRKFRVSIFGESHGEAIGVVLDGVQPGIPLCVDDFTADILRRKSGPKGTTPRIEADVPELLSGVYNGFTTGAPLAIIFRNRNTKSGDYKLFNDIPRPGHADYTASIKWMDFNDPRGGGHFSGRLTLPIVAAGVVAKKMCVCGITARLIEVGGVSREDALESLAEADLNGVEPDSLPPSTIWKDVIGEAIKERDSIGGVVECVTTSVPAGLGEPFFDSVESLLSHAIFSIPGVRGIEFGDGFRAARMKGSEHNDPFDVVDSRHGDMNLHLSVHPSRNGAGGVNGGITNGNPIVFRVAFKPTSSISKPQKTFNFATGQMAELEIPGRHDACFALRTPPVVEAMTAIVLADLMKRI